MAFKMPTGKELDKMLDQLSENDKKAIRHKFEEDVKKEQTNYESVEKMLIRYGRGLSSMLYEIRQMPDNAPIFPIKMSLYYELDIRACYKILQELEREKITRSMLFLPCNNCGYEMLFGSIGDVGKSMICPNCKKIIQLPAWDKIQIVYRRIKND